ncbi:MAG: TIGR00282 family metallophosphoesterase [Acidobacteriota bacterium]
MRILFIGDLVGKPGRQILRAEIDRLVDRYRTDFVIANVENSAGGFGVTPEIAQEVLSAGVHCLTSGNHIWDRKEIGPYLEDEPRLLRPLNYPPPAQGRGTWVGETAAGVRVGVLNLMGRVFMTPLLCPFLSADEALRELHQQTRVIVVDFHAEATSEKIAMAWYLDGRASAVIGTHTHVQTADERVLPGGTACITDVGMTGSHDGIIGIERPLALQRFLTQRPVRFSTAMGNVHLKGALIDIDETSGRARSISRISIPDAGS